MKKLKTTLFLSFCLVFLFGSGSQAFAQKTAKRLEELNYQTEHLELAGYEMKLQSFPTQILSYTQLKSLMIIGSNMPSIPKEIAKLKNLTKLVLFGIPLKTLPAEIGQLTNLTHLKIWDTQITSLPKEIG